MFQHGHEYIPYEDKTEYCLSHFWRAKLMIARNNNVDESFTVSELCETGEHEIAVAFENGVPKSISVTQVVHKW